MNNLSKTSVILASGVIFLTMMLTIMSIPVDLRAQLSTLSEIYEQGMEAKERGEFEQSFLIWEKAGKQPGYAIGREYLKLAAELAHKEKYETATRMYYRGVSEALSHPADRRAFSEDLLHLELLMKPDEFEKKFELVKSDDAELQKAVRLFWENADPLPAEPVNPRLVEHYGRISEALSKFPDESSPLGFDDRGKVWVRFGEPDKKQ
ncbi:MAG TPA: GWxTD domain-containing protein, partial [Balneolaceae bacterium]|nr:GWxTD domain-containing protein [Balneolaceae bacterium]